MYELFAMQSGEQMKGIALLTSSNNESLSRPIVGDRLAAASDDEEVSLAAADDGRVR